MTEESEMAKYIVYGLDGDPELPMLNVCNNSTDMGPYVVSVVGVGNPYYAFESLPIAILAADEIGADFNEGMLASADYQTNRNNVAAMYASPPLVDENPGTGVMVWKVA